MLQFLCPESPSVCQAFDFQPDHPPPPDLLACLQGYPTDGKSCSLIHPPRLALGNSPGKNTGVGCHVLLHEISPTWGSKPRSPTLQADSLLAEPPGKSKNTEEGSLSLLQGNFLTQESNRVLLHCRWILNQLSYRQVYSSVKC